MSAGYLTNGFEMAITDERGGLIPLDRQERQDNSQQIDRIAASAMVALAAQHASGAGYQPATFDTFAEAKGWSVAQRMHAKAHIARTGEDLPTMMRRFNLH